MPKYFSGRDAGAAPGRMAIIVSRYNDTITNRLLQGALETLAEAGLADDAVDVCWVPGAWEIPVVAQELASDSRYAGLICLGAVIRGETTHDEHINRQVSLSLGQIALDKGLPVAFGVLTCNTLEQALQRAGGKVGNKGREAAEAALETWRLLHQLREQRGERAAESSRPLVAPRYESRRERPRPTPNREPRPLFPEEGVPVAPPNAAHTPADNAAAESSSSVPPASPASGMSARPNAPATASTGKRAPRPRRRRGREIVLQMLYADDVHPGRNMADADEFLRRRLNFEPTLIAFATELLSGVRKNRGEIDALLSRQTTNWSLQRMAVTDRNVLRLGAYELLYTDTPRVVVINEAVDLARRYGSQQSAPFVNGILDRLNVERRSAPAE